MKGLVAFAFTLIRPFRISTLFLKHLIKSEIEAHARIHRVKWRWLMKFIRPFRISTLFLKHLIKSEIQAHAEFTE